MSQLYHMSLTITWPKVEKVKYYLVQVARALHLVLLLKRDYRIHINLY